MIYHGPISGIGKSDAMSIIGSLLEQRTGQQISASRAWRLEAALKPILRELEMTSLDQLVHGLMTTRNPSLSDTVVDALLNQETSFFRDAAVLDMVAEVLETRAAEAPSRRLRIWSAGCSTGQEPLSLAMLVTERRIGQALIPDIIASDVSTGAIARAKAARYSQFEVQRGLSIHRMMAWFEAEGSEWTANRDLVDQIQFRLQNLVSDAVPAGGFDVVLCRNILLYLSPEVRREVFDRLATALRPGGVLVLGASETVIGQTDKFTPHEKWRGLYRLA